jgi:hypothetical protein
MPEPPSQDAGLFHGRELTLCSSLGVPSAFLPLVLEAQAESRKKTTREERANTPCFIEKLVDDLVSHFKGAGWGAWENIGDRGLGIDGDRLNLTNHFLATVDDHGEAFDKLIIFAEV